MDRSMRKKKPLRQHHHHIKIPEEIVTDEILPRLPVKSLLRFRCVSKPWLSLIDSDRFIKTHLQNSTQNPDYSHWRVVFNSESGLKQSSMPDYFDEESLNLPPIDDPTIDEEMATAEIVGSCNGVVCLFNHAGGRFFLWNPATRNHTKLPRVECATSELGFGWDERSCAFKVFVVVRSDDEEYRHIGMVYNSETESWMKTADYEYMFLLFGTGKFASGKIHWMTYSKYWNIEFFDLRREVFGRIELPKPCNPTVFVCPLMWETMGCLGLILDSYDDDHGIRRRVWVMKDEGCWVEVAKEPCLELISEPGKGILVQSLVSPRRRRINESSS